MAIATAALPYLARTVQRLIEIFIVLVAMASAVGGHGLPVNVAGSLAIGWGATALIQLVFGSPLGLPSSDEVGAARELGVGAASLRLAPRQVWGVARFAGRPRRARTGRHGRRLSIDVYGRDAADAKLLTKAGRFVLYRDSGPTLRFTRLQQVEHEAYLMLRAARAGADVPELVEADIAGPAGDALIVCRLPGGARAGRRRRHRRRATPPSMTCTASC